MLSLDKTTICKSLLQRELRFYINIPSELRQFTPELKGVLYAQLEEADHTANYKFKATKLYVKTTTSSSNESLTEDHLTNSSDNAISERKTAYEKTLFKGLERFKYKMSSGFTGHPWTIDKDAEAITEFVGANPWAVRQHRREINLILSRSNVKSRTILQTPIDAEGNTVPTMERDSCAPGKHIRGYLMLEDMSSNFDHPNVIDFKLGRQIERDDCSQEKKVKHVQLVKNSSTGTLMLRIAGMQVYQVETGHYLCRDKYYGRGLSADGFKEALFLFLHNGRRHMIEIIPSIMEKLASLRMALEKQLTFRFYASSLLILYEGGDITCDAKVKACNCNEQIKEGCARTDDSNKCECNGQKNPSRKIDVRMIDFAHSTYKGFNDDKASFQGPDEDCLLALDNLMKILKEIEKEVLESGR